MTVTLAPVIALPCASRTAPLSVALVWAAPVIASDNRRIMIVNIRSLDKFIRIYKPLRNVIWRVEFKRFGIAEENVTPRHRGVAIR
jgi:hypothetical protein